MNKLKQVHAYTLRNGIDHNKILIVKLLQVPDIHYARSIFNYIREPSAFLYNKFIQSYTSHGQCHQCLTLYSQMCRQGCQPNQHSFTFLFSACASLSCAQQGQMLHNHFVKSGFESDVFALTALVDMYGKLGMMRDARKKFDEMTIRDIPTWNSLLAGYSRCGDMEGALTVFGMMPSRNVVSWTTVISGFSQNGQYEKALAMFTRMENEKGMDPNEVTIASILPACANLGALEIAEKIASYAREKGFLKNLFVSNALLEMYARCGKLDMAVQVFDAISSQRNLCSWNSMVMGLAVHGRCNDALELFDKMLDKEIFPDDVTFVGVLLACTHGGMVAKGLQLFQSMENDFSISRKLEHYGCMVDLLGRGGKLREAFNLIESMPMKPDSVVWGALLGACSFYGNVEFAEKAANSLFELEPWNPANYVILSNIYASAGRWDGVAKLRKTMKGGQLTKSAGHSLIEDDGQIHTFIVDDRSHPRSEEIYALLNEVSTKMKMKKNPIDCEF